MIFSRTRKIEGNVFETKIAFKSFGGDPVYTETEEKRLINDFGYPSIEIGYIQGKYDATVKDGKKIIKATCQDETISNPYFESDPLDGVENMATSGTEKFSVVCKEGRGKKKLDERFEVTLRLPVKDEKGTPVSISELKSDALSEYEGKCRIFEETIITRAKLAMEALYAKDTIFEIEPGAEEVTVKVNEEEKTETVTDGIYIG